MGRGKNMGILGEYTKAGAKHLLRMTKTVALMIATISMVAQPTYVFADPAAPKYPFSYGPNGQLYYDCNTGSSNVQKTLGKVYILGDSITHGAREDYEKAFKDAGATDVKVNAAGGRNFNGPGTTGDVGTGYAAIGADGEAKDKDAISSANTIIMAIGTNQMENMDYNMPENAYVQKSQDSIKKAMDAIKKLAPKAQVFWVDVAISAAGPGPYPGFANRIDKAIYKSASTEGYSTISWAKVVDPSYNPEDASGPVKDDQHLLADGIHPNDDGRKKLVETVVNGAKEGMGGGTGDSSNDGAAAPASTDNAEPTKEQKIAKLMIVGFDAQDPDKILGYIDKYKIGGLFPHGENVASVFNKGFFEQAVTKSLGTFISTGDEEGGPVQRYVSDNPAAADLDSKTPEEITAAGEKVGQALQTNGVNVDLAPVVDAAPRNASNHLANGRSFSPDVAKAGEDATHFAQGLVRQKVVPTFKHFPGIGSVAGNSDEVRTSIEYNKDDATKAFKGVGETSGVVMLSNSYITNMDNLPAPVNKKLIDAVHNDISYTDAILTDDMASLVKYNGSSLDNTIADALIAGSDVPLVTWPGEDEFKKIIDTVKQKVPDERINDAYTKALALAQRSQVEPVKSCCGDGGKKSTLTGDNNAAKAFNYFVSKGWSPEQAAGIVGNMIMESGVGPRRNQNEPLDKLVNADQATGPGWGIVQWTPQGKYIDPVKAAGKNPNDLLVQLEFLQAQLTDASAPISEKGAGDDLKRQTTVKGASESFEFKYERHGADDSGPKRAAAAQAILDAAKNGKSLPPELEAAISKDSGLDGGQSSSLVAPSGGGSGGGGGGDSQSCALTPSGDYQDPHRDLKDMPSRVDGGYDWATDDVEKPVYPFGPAKIDGIKPDSGSSGWPGVPGSYIRYIITAGPLKGKYMYEAEDCTPKVREGDTLDSNKELCTYTYKDSWLEVGFSKEEGGSYPDWSNYGGGETSNSGTYMADWYASTNPKHKPVVFNTPPDRSGWPADWPKPPKQAPASGGN